MKSRVVSMFCLAVAVTVLMASDASAQCPRRGGCSAVVDSVVQTYSPAETIVMSDVDKCVDGVCPSQPAAGWSQ